MAAAGEAAADPLAADASAAFNRRMVEMQNELKQMQRLQSEMKDEDARSQKELQACQRELEAVSRQIGAVEVRRQKLQKEFQAVHEELAKLEEKKAATTKKIHDMTFAREHKRAEKLRALGGKAPTAEAVQRSPSPAKAASQVGSQFLPDLLQEPEEPAASTEGPGDALEGLDFGAVSLNANLIGGEGLQTPVPAPGAFASMGPPMPMQSALPQALHEPVLAPGAYDSMGPPMPMQGAWPQTLQEVLPAAMPQSLPLGIQQTLQPAMPPQGITQPQGMQQAIPHGMLPQGTFQQAMPQGIQPQGAAAVAGPSWGGSSPVTQPTQPSPPQQVDPFFDLLGMPQQGRGNDTNK